MIALAIGLERDLADPCPETAIDALGLGQTDRGDLRPAVRRAGLFGVVHLVDVAVAGDRMGRDQALVGGRVSQPQPADGVSDGIDVRLLGPHPAVDLDHAAVDLHRCRLKPDLLDVGGAAGRDEKEFGAQSRWLPCRPGQR